LVGHTEWENVGCGCLRRIIGPMRDDGTGESRKLRNKELNDL